MDKTDFIAACVENFCNSTTNLEVNEQTRAKVFGWYTYDSAGKKIQVIACVLAEDFTDEKAINKALNLGVQNEHLRKEDFRD